MHHTLVNVLKNNCQLYTTIQCNMLGRHFSTDDIWNAGESQALHVSVVLAVLCNMTSSKSDLHIRVVLLVSYTQSYNNNNNNTLGNDNMVSLSVSRFELTVLCVCVCGLLGWRICLETVSMAICSSSSWLFEKVKRNDARCKAYWKGLQDL